MRAWTVAGMLVLQFLAVENLAADRPMAARPPGRITNEDRRYWAFQPVRLLEPPNVGNSWAKNDIDRFIFQKQQAAGLQPAPTADRTTLIRRLSFDLIGLPPTPAEIDAFLADASASAYENLVDRLLASPRYGERWARHWLDLVHYAESDGYRLDEYRPTAWRYRDYVIHSFNKDKPYDQFIREQIAGDELDPDNPEALAATGFLRLWIYEYNQRDVHTQRSVILNDITDVLGDVFLGLGMGCARCHDHKFDPILQKDYYRLQAFFANIMPHDDLPVATAKQTAEYQKNLQQWTERTAEVRQKIAELDKPHREKAERDAISKFPAETQAMIRKPVAERSPLEHQIAEMAYRQVTYEFDRIDTKMKDADKKKRAELLKELAAFDMEKPEALPVTLTVRDVGPHPPPTFIPKKSGGVAIEPGVPTVIDDKPAVIARVPTAPQSSGRRAALAQWLTRPDNPLTARVIVNRMWQQHFGRGIVGTASDFGHLGDPPTHPELLDWLAHRFVQGGWSFKKLHRFIVTSATYQQASSPSSITSDPENRWLARVNPRRLDAEQIRDAMLSVAGEMDAQEGGPSVAYDKPRRSVYCQMARNKRDPVLDVFDCPDGFASTAQRNVTTTATQALLMLNGPFGLKRAKSLAERITREQANEGKRIDRAYQLCFGRTPVERETKAAVTFLDQYAKRMKAAIDAEARSLAFVDFCHALLNANEFIYVD